MFKLSNTAQNEMKRSCIEQWFDLMMDMMLFGSIVHDPVVFEGSLLGLMLWIFLKGYCCIPVAIMMMFIISVI